MCLQFFNLSVPILLTNLMVWLENKASVTRLKTGSFYYTHEKTHRPHVTAAPPTYYDLLHIAAKYKVVQISATTTLMLMQLQF